MHKLALLLPTLLIACVDTAKGDDTASGDSGGGDAVFDGYTAEQAETAFHFIDAPEQMVLVVSFLMAGDATSCPAVTDDGTLITVTGGCTTDDGTSYEGAVIFAEDGATWTGWVMSDADSTIEVDGAQQRLESGELISDMTITAAGTTTVYTDHHLSSLEDWYNVVFGGEGGYTLTGEMQVSSVDTFTLDATVTNGTACEDEADDATFTLTGMQVITYTQSADACDGCTDWVNEDGSGSFCPAAE